jgi:hypothetical protein
MIVIISSIVVALTVLLAAFVNFAPNVHNAVESDFRRRAISDTNLYSLQRGQLAIRAGNLKITRSMNMPCGPDDSVYLYRVNSTSENNVNARLTYLITGNLQVDNNFSNSKSGTGCP